MMAVSLTGSWRQPVYVDIDSKISKNTVMKMISDLFSIGYYVACFSSDCSDKSVALWSDLGATVDQPFFPHPVKGSVVVVPDALHAVGLLRDNLLDSGFKIEGSIISRAPLDALLETGVCSKLKTCHLRCDSAEKRRSDLAVQLLSNTVGTALISHKPGNPDVATSTGNFLKVINHWFDLMNVATADFTVPFRSAYGHKRLDQDKLLNHVKSVVSCMKCGENKALLPFQIGIIMSCNGLPLLYNEINKYGSKFEYIVTQSLNHTSMNNLFSLLSPECSDDPSPITALDRLRLNLFGENADTPLEKNSLFSYVIRRAKINLGYRQRDIFTSIAPNLLDVIFSSSEYIAENKLSHLSLSLIAEQINLGLKHKYPQLCKCGNRSGLDENPGHEPTAYFMGNLVKMENSFEMFTRGRFISECKKIVLRLTRTMKGFSNPLPHEVIKIFVRLRIEIYVRSLVPKLPQIVIKRQMQCKLLNALRSSV